MQKPTLTRRGFLATCLAAASARALPPVAERVLPQLRQKRILTLVYDKSVGAMRAIDRIVP